MLELIRAKLYQVRIKPVAGTEWIGLFGGEEPRYQNILDAMELDIEALDTQIEHEEELSRELRSCAMEVLRSARANLFDDVRVADVYLGFITLEIFHHFTQIEEDTNEDA